MATVTNSIGTAAAATGISGTISGTAFTCTGVTGTIKVGMTLSGGGATACKILSGPGGTGAYTVDVSQSSTLSGATAARDFSSINAYSASLPSSFVTAANSYVAELYNDGLLTSTSTNSISGHTTDSTHTLTLKCAAGHSFRDNANAATNALKFNQANGVAVQGTGSFIAAFTTDCADALIDGIQFQNTGTGNSTVSSGNAFAQNVTIQNCIIEGADNVLTLNRGKAYNNIIILTGTAGYGIQCAPFSVVDGNTIVRPSDIAAAGTGIQAIYGGGAIYNNAIFGFTTPGSGWSSGSYSNNATDGASLPAGTSNLTSRTYANQFVNTTTASRDFRTKSGADLINAGATQGLTVDIMGIVRPQGAAYDIGCWEYVAAGTAYTLSAAQGAFSETGKAAVPIYGRKMVGAQASFSENGQAAILKCGRKLVAVRASFSETGLAATLGLLKSFAAARANFSLTGKIAVFKIAARIPVLSGSVMWTGYAARFVGVGQIWTRAGSATDAWLPVASGGEVWISRLPVSTSWTLR